MKEKNAEERYQIAKTLDSIIFTRDLITDEQMFALLDAVEIISPEFVAEQAAEIEAAMNSPEAAPFAAEAMNTDAAKAILAELEDRRIGKILQFRST